MKDAANDWVRAREVFERRNIVVHHDCRVSEQYLSKVGTAAEGVSAGDRLDVTEEYLRTAIEDLLNLGLSLGVRVWGEAEQRIEQALLPG